MRAKLLVFFVSTSLLASFCIPIDGGYVNIPPIHSMLENLSKEISATIDSNNENLSLQQKSEQQIYVRKRNTDQIVFPKSEPEPHPLVIESMEQAKKPLTVDNRNAIGTSGQSEVFCDQSCGHKSDEPVHQGSDVGLTLENNQH